MSNPDFIEARSADPVERALARQAARLLNDPSLSHAQRVALVRRLQQALLRHRGAAQPQAPTSAPSPAPAPSSAPEHTGTHALLAQARALALPAGWQAVSVQVVQGRVQVGARSRGAFVWHDAGLAPQGAAPNQHARDARDAIAERRAARQAGRF